MLSFNDDPRTEGVIPIVLQLISKSNLINQSLPRIFGVGNGSEQKKRVVVSYHELFQRIHGHFSWKLNWVITSFLVIKYEKNESILNHNHGEPGHGMWS